MHKGLNQSNLALIAAGILTELARRVQVQPFNKLLEIGLIDASPQVTEVCENLFTSQISVKRKLAWQVTKHTLDFNRMFPAVQPSNVCCASVGTQESHKHTNGGCLACTVGTKKAKDFALFYLEGDIDNAAFAPITFSQMIGLN